MGFLDLFKSQWVCSPGGYWDMDSDRRLPVALKCGESMAPAIGGTIKTREDGDEVHVTGEIEGRRVRVIIEVSFGAARLEVKASRRLDLRVPYHIQYDSNAPAHAHESATRDEWDDDDDSDQRLYLSAHTYFQGAPGVLRHLLEKHEALPEDLRAAVIDTLEGHGDVGYFQVVDDTAALQVPNTITLRRDSAERIVPLFSLLAKLTTAMEMRW